MNDRQRWVGVMMQASRNGLVHKATTTYMKLNRFSRRVSYSNLSPNDIAMISKEVVERRNKRVEEEKALTNDLRELHTRRLESFRYGAEDLEHVGIKLPDSRLL